MRSDGYIKVELVLVAAMIALLSIIGLHRYSRAAEFSKFATVNSDLTAINNAITFYRVDWGANPISCAPDFQVGTRIPILLTTPVAYLESLPLDPFNETEPGPPYFDPNEWQRYVYLNMAQFDVTNSVLCGMPIFTFEEVEEPWGSWLVYSYGPDLEPFGPPGQTYQVANIYDPTNGTNSAGNIWISPVLTPSIPEDPPGSDMIVIK